MTGRMSYMVETVTGSSDGLAAAAQLLHDFNLEYDDRATTVAERLAVGQALGIVMERHKLSEAEAFALLQRTAEHRRVRVRLVAQELVARAEGANSDE